eukprot:3363877-Rhodomonas_salina.3
MWCSVVICTAAALLSTTPSVLRTTDTSTLRKCDSSQSATARKKNLGRVRIRSGLGSASAWAGPKHSTPRVSTALPLQTLLVRAPSALRWGVACKLSICALCGQQPPGAAHGTMRLGALVRVDCSATVAERCYGSAIVSSGSRRR